MSVPNSRLATAPRVFIYRPGAIGDTILTLPALNAVRARFPGCDITFAGNAACLPLLGVEHPLRADDPLLLPMFSDPPRRFDAFDVQIIFARHPIAFGDIERDPLEAVARSVHMADWLVDAVDPSYPDRIPRLDVAPVFRDRLVLLPSAGNAAKRWPAGCFARLANIVGLPVTIAVGGEAEAVATAVNSQLDQPAAEMMVDVPLAELARHLAGAALVVGNDSGISHLAAALGVPTIALYLTTDPAVWGVRGRRAISLPAAGVSAEAVREAALGLIA